LIYEKLDIYSRYTAFCGSICGRTSAYGAGNLDSDTPYGLSPSEKKIYQNIKDIKSLKRNLGSIKVSLNNLNERLEGVRSVTDSMSSKIGEIDQRLYAIENGASADYQNIKEQLASLKDDLNATREIQTKNQEEIKNVLKELSSLIDSINSNYVSKSELDSFKEEINSKIDKLLIKAKESSLSKKSGAELLSEAKKYYNKKEYQEAKNQIRTAS